MALPELTICTSTEAAEDDEVRARITPSTSCSCTPRSSSAPAAEPSSAMFYSNPWSSPNSSPRSTGSSHSSANLLHPHSNSKAVPIITLKTRHHLSAGGRDQVSVDEEVWQLKRALLEKDMELRRRKAHAANVEAENRKLVKDMEHVVGATEDPNLNQQGSRMESPCKLQAKLASTNSLVKVLEGRD